MRWVVRICIPEFQLKFQMKWYAQIIRQSKMRNSFFYATLCAFWFCSWRLGKWYLDYGSPVSSIEIRGTSGMNLVTWVGKDKTSDSLDLSMAPKLLQTRRSSPYLYRGYQHPVSSGKRVYRRSMTYDLDVIDAYRPNFLPRSNTMTKFDFTNNGTSHLTVNIAELAWLSSVLRVTVKNMNIRHKYRRSEMIY